MLSKALQIELSMSAMGNDPKAYVDNTAGASDIRYITATDPAWPIPAGWQSAIVEVYGAGGGAASYTLGGGAGGDTSVVYGGETVIGQGGAGGKQSNGTEVTIPPGNGVGGDTNLPGAGSHGGNVGSVSNGYMYTPGAPGGLAIKQLDLSGGGTLNITIGAGGAGTASGSGAGQNGGNGLVILRRAS